MATLDRHRKSNFRDVRCCDPAAEVHNVEDDEDVTSNGGITIYLWVAQRGKRARVKTFVGGGKSCNKTSTIKTKGSRKKKQKTKLRKHKLHLCQGGSSAGETALL